MIGSDVIIIGAGMAGASLAAEIAGNAKVILLEAEDAPGRHSTGRSAAFWSESYGGPGVQPLTTASGQFLASPPADFHPTGFLHPRGALHVADADGIGHLEKMSTEFAASGVAMEWLDRPALETRIPGLRPGWVRALAEPSCSDIEVASLHGAYLRWARKLGAELIVNAEVTGIERRGRRWRLETAAGPMDADVLVNAAGAWADRVAGLAGCAPLGIQPYRRTVSQLRVFPSVPADLPLIIDAAERFYFKPESGRLWLSPHDETPSAPSDCAPEEIDIAVAIDRLQKVVDWQVERVEHSWAGLRSFAPDRLPVYGYDSAQPGFFWFAGQGGFGIQTAPAAAHIGAAQLLNRTPAPMVAAIDPGRYAPDRFTN